MKGLKSGMLMQALFFLSCVIKQHCAFVLFSQVRKLGEEQRNLPAWVTTAMVYQMVVVYQSPQQPK